MESLTELLLQRERWDKGDSIVVCI